MEMPPPPPPFDGSHVQDTDDGNAPEGSQDTDDGNAPDGSQDTDYGNAPDGSQDTDDGNAPSSSNSQDDSSESRVLNEVLHLLGASPISNERSKGMETHIARRS